MKNRFHIDYGKVLVLVLAAVVGTGAGIVATVLTSRAIDNYAASLLDDRRFTALAPTKVPTLPGTYEESLSSLRKNAWRAIASFSPASPDSGIASGWIDTRDTKGFGVVVSADGWVLTTNAVYPPATSLTTYDVWVEKGRYHIERIVRDPFSALVLVKLKDAGQLQSVGFGAAPYVESGAMAFAIHHERELAPLTVLRAENEMLFGVQKAETFTTNWLVDMEVANGTPIFSPSGDLVGFASGGGQVFPLHHSRGFVQDVVRTGAPRAPAIGLYVVDLARLYNVPPELKQGRTAGALVLPPSTSVTPVVKGGPADKAGILVRDIITDVDGVAVTAERTLPEILSEYEPGEIANVRLLRNGQSVEVAVTLGDLKDLIY